jgi:uncharacterized glyoxalase superfamily protein PhnB
MARQMLIPSLHYNDAEAAAAWLERVFGFEPAMMITDDSGKLVHGEMRCAGALVMIGAAGWAEEAKSPASVGGANTQRVHLEVPDVDALYQRVVAQGGFVWREPEDQFYGARTFGARDLEGHMWTFNQHMRDVSDEEMSKASGLTVKSY